MKPRLEEAIRLALAARERAYAPYSHFAVGATVITATGELFAGCNVENASYGLTICAERSAAVQAVAAGQLQFRSVVVASVGGVAPCGACRQFLFEFGDHLQVVAIDVTRPDAHRSWKIDELLPAGFRLSQPVDPTNRD